MNKPLHQTFLIMVLLFLTLMTVACSDQNVPVEPTSIITDTPQPDNTATPEPSPESTREIEDQVIITPTPQPTATPGFISELVSDITQATRMKQVRFLGLTGEDWVNLFISVAFLLIGVFLIIRLVVVLLRKLVSLTPSEYDDQLLRALLFHIRFFIIVLFIEFGIQRLAFVSAETKNLVYQIYRVLLILLFINALWRTVDLSLEWQIQKRGLEKSSQQVKIVLPILRQLVRILLVILGAVFILNTFGVNITALITLLGIGGLAFSLAAQDTLSDFISGIIILVDQPYREGDRIEINQLGTWGDVVHIGARTTRIRTRDNRMVIVPNSQIGKSQIVNYTYPDPRFRIETNVGVAYGSDMALVDTTIIEGIRTIPGVLSDKPVDVLVTDLGDSAIQLRVRWWINSYTDTRQITNSVNRVLIKKLDEAGILMPLPAYDINLQLNEENAARIARALKGGEDKLS